MVFRHAVLQCFDQTWGRDRTRHKSNAYRHKWLRREGFRSQSGPEAMAISRHSGEASDSVGLHKIVYLTTLYICGAVIPSTEAGIAGSGPRLRYSLRDVLRVGAHIKSGGSVAPNLPGRL